jgi:MYXO-CTERM domain-containing protein
VDRNCDGFAGEADNDGDGFPACADCDDGDAARYPGAADAPYDGVSLDCDRTSDFDADADGAESVDYGGTDCDDNDPSISPFAEEILGDGIDSNCDGDPGAALPDQPGYTCACDGQPTGGPTWVAAMAILVARARRRR